MQFLCEVIYRHPEKKQSVAGTFKVLATPFKTVFDEVQKRSNTLMKNVKMTWNMS